MSRQLVALLVGLVIALAACSIRGGGDVDVGTLPVIVVLTFEDRDVGDGLVAPVPIGWEAPDPNFPRIFRPPPNAGMSRAVTLWWVDVACGGECRSRTSASWAEVVMAAEFAQFEDPDAFVDIRRSESGPGFRLIEAENNFGVVALTLARWEEGASAYLACRAALPIRQADLAADFETACRTVAPPAQ